MKISKKTVNGKSYIYALDSIYVNRGKTIQKNKSLGPSATWQATYKPPQSQYLR